MTQSTFDICVGNLRKPAFHQVEHFLQEMCSCKSLSMERIHVTVTLCTYTTEINTLNHTLYKLYDKKISMVTLQRWSLYTKETKKAFVW
jgi:hypothetical protein